MMPLGRMGIYKTVREEDEVVLLKLVHDALASHGIHGSFTFVYEIQVNPVSYKAQVVIHRLQLEDERDRFIVGLYGEKNLLSKLCWDWTNPYVFGRADDHRERERKQRRQSSV
jgi:hypothetical protein